MISAIVRNHRMGLNMSRRNRTTGKVNDAERRGGSLSVRTVTSQPRAVRAVAIIGVCVAGPPMSGGKMLVVRRTRMIPQRRIAFQASPIA
jgi:hypothetical protein